jgi:heme-degrading monooxygenase HmoA
MYVQVAHYRLATGSAEELADRVREGPLKVMPEIDGFIDYYAFDAGGAVVASVSVFETKAGVDEAEARLAEWIERTVGEFDISPEHMSEGPAFAATHGKG